MVTNSRKQVQDADEGHSDDHAGSYSASKLSEHLEVQRTRVICGPEMNYHVNTVTSAMAYMACGVDNSWQHAAWADNFAIEVTQLSQDVIEFELQNIDPALVNALRRILIGEVPSVCIEHVFIIDNTSVMAEEILSHRLGLVPLRIDPDALDWRDDKASDRNTVVFKMHVECTRDADGRVTNDSVYSKDLVWLPGGSEFGPETGAAFATPQPDSLAAAPVHDDILLCRLVPGQVIELEAHAVKGIGEDHAKFSPVATAWHRLYPEIVTLEAPPKAVAERLVAEVPEVFSLSKKGKLRVGNARQHEDKLERVRYLSGLDEFKEYIQVRKRKEHFIFTIESTGVLPAQTLFLRALTVLREKCVRLNEMLE